MTESNLQIELAVCFIEKFISFLGDPNQALYLRLIKYQVQLGILLGTAPTEFIL